MPWRAKPRLILTTCLIKSEALLEFKGGPERKQATDIILKQHSRSVNILTCCTHSMESEAMLDFDYLLDQVRGAAIIQRRARVEAGHRRHPQAALPVRLGALLLLGSSRNEQREKEDMGKGACVLCTRQVRLCALLLLGSFRSGREKGLAGAPAFCCSWGHAGAKKKVKKRVGKSACICPRFKSDTVCAAAASMTSSIIHNDNWAVCVHYTAE